jgi:hypothetical protein
MSFPSSSVIHLELASPFHRSDPSNHIRFSGHIWLPPTEARNSEKSGNAPNSTARPYLFGLLAGGKVLDWLIMTELDGEDQIR